MGIIVATIFATKSTSILPDDLIPMIISFTFVAWILCETAKAQNHSVSALRLSPRTLRPVWRALMRL